MKKPCLRPSYRPSRANFSADLRKATIVSNSALALNGNSELISTPPSINQAEALAQALWQALDKHYQGKLHPQQLLKQVQDLDGDLATLYADYLASALDIDAYIHLYEQIDLYFNGDLDEMFLRQFFLAQDITAARLLERLKMAGLTVKRFFQQMKGRHNCTLILFSTDHSKLIYIFDRDIPTYFFTQTSSKQLN